MKIGGTHGDARSVDGKKLKELAQRPEEFIGRLKIVDEKGQERY